MTSTTYKSNFLKADTRKEQSNPGSTSFLSKNNDTVALTDIFLSPGAAISVKLNKEDLNIIFPIVGMLILNEDERELSPEELYCYCGTETKEVTIANPFAAETINFLHVSVKKNAHAFPTTGVSISKLNMNAKNQLIKSNGMASCIKVGIYDSRVKDNTPLTQNNNCLFTYIINGSFDFEERLMEYRDSLYQWDIAEIEFEALSETAIILIIECSHLK